MQPRRPSWDGLLFSAKESIYKAWYPLTHVSLGFEKAGRPRCTSAPTIGSARLVHRPIVPGETAEVLRGRWLTEDGVVVTATTLT